GRMGADGRPDRLRGVCDARRNPPVCRAGAALAAAVCDLGGDAGRLREAWRALPGGQAGAPDGGTLAAGRPAAVLSVGRAGPRDRAPSAATPQREARREDIATRRP